MGRSEEEFDAEHTTEIFFYRFQLYNWRVQAIHIYGCYAPDMHVQMLV